MQIRPHRTEDDATGFLELVESVVAGALFLYRPDRLYLVHIDNWFDHTWLEYSGKSLGAVGWWKHGEHLTIPPFVPNRVLAQQHWARDPESGSFVSEPAAPVHIWTDSGSNLQRRVSVIAPEAALLWYTGKTAVNNRGAIMVHVPDGEEDGYWAWYVGFSGKSEWAASEFRGISREEFRRLFTQELSNGGV